MASTRVCVCVHSKLIEAKTLITIWTVIRSNLFHRFHLKTLSVYRTNFLLLLLLTFVPINGMPIRMRHVNRILCTAEFHIISLAERLSFNESHVMVREWEWADVGAVWNTLRKIFQQFIVWSRNFAIPFVLAALRIWQDEIINEIDSMPLCISCQN